MANRDKARSDLYLAQLRSQSAPNTPGWNMADRKEPMDSGFYTPGLEEGHGGTQYASSAAPQLHHPVPFVLQPPPAAARGATPMIQQTGFTPISSSREERVDYPPPSPMRISSPEVRQEHFAAAPGETVYDSVPIPGAYEGEEHR